MPYRRLVAKSVWCRSKVAGTKLQTVEDRLNDTVSASMFDGASDLEKVKAAIAAVKATVGKKFAIIIPSDFDSSFNVPMLNLAANQGITILDMRPSKVVSDSNTPITSATVLGADVVITAATQARPCVITAAGHPLTAGQVKKITISGATGMTSLNGYFVATYVSPTQLSINIDTSGSAALTGAPIINAPTLIATGAAHGMVAGQITELAIGGAGLDAAWLYASNNFTLLEATYYSATEFLIYRPLGTAYVTGATIKWVPTAWRGAFGALQIYLEGRDAGGGYASEVSIAAKHNPGISLDSLSDGTAPGYPNSNRGTSIVVRKNGVGQWQLVSDPLFNGMDIWTFLHLGSSKQMLSMYGNGAMSYGQKSTFDFTIPAYSHSFRGSSFCYENNAGNLVTVWRLSDNSKRKIWTYDTAADAIFLANTANNGNVWGIDDYGFVYTPVKGNVASAAAITPTGKLFAMTGTAAVATINPPYASFRGTIKILPIGSFTTSTAGNIKKATVAEIGRVLEMTYDGTLWWPSY